MDDLVKFLTEQWDRIEALAKTAAEGGDPELGNPGRWSAYLEGGTDGWAFEDASGTVAATVESKALADHIAGNDPEYVLEDIAAKRVILADCVYVLSSAEDSWGQGVSAHELAGDTLKNLALPFAGHEGYRAEWKNGALPIPVTPTYPPSQQVRVLGVDVHCGPAYVNHSRAVVVGIGPDGVEVQRGAGSERGIPDIPALPDGFSPIAVVRLLASQACIQERDIWPLAPGETIPKGWRSGRSHP